MLNSALIYNFLDYDDLAKASLCFMIFIFLLAFPIMSYLMNCVSSDYSVHLAWLAIVILKVDFQLSRGNCAWKVMEREAMLRHMEHGALRSQTAYKILSHQKGNPRSSQKNGCFGLLVGRGNGNCLSFSVQSKTKCFRFTLES